MLRELIDLLLCDIILLPNVLRRQALIDNLPEECNQLQSPVILVLQVLSHNAEGLVAGAAVFRETNELVLLLDRGELLLGGDRKLHLLK